MKTFQGLDSSKGKKKQFIFLYHCFYYLNILNQQVNFTEYNSTGHRSAGHKSSGILMFPKTYGQKVAFKKIFQTQMNN